MYANLPSKTDASGFPLTSVNHPTPNPSVTSQLPMQNPICFCLAPSSHQTDISRVRAPRASSIYSSGYGFGPKSVGPLSLSDFALSESPLRFMILNILLPDQIIAIRNQKGAIILSSCVGTAYSGSASLLQDLVQDGVSLLLIGRGWKNNNFQVQSVFWSVTLGSVTLLWADSRVHPIIETIIDINSEVSPNMQEV